MQRQLGDPEQALRNRRQKVDQVSSRSPYFSRNLLLHKLLCLSLISFPSTYIYIAHGARTTYSMCLSVTSVADPDPFDTDPDPAFYFYADPDPYHFEEAMYLKQYFLIHPNLIFLVSRPNRTQPEGILC
jgi:hypothetical protein